MLIKRMWEAIKRLFFWEKHEYKTVNLPSIVFVKPDNEEPKEKPVSKQKISKAIHELRYNITPGIGGKHAPFRSNNLIELLSEYDHVEPIGFTIGNTISKIQIANKNGFPRIRPAEVKISCQELLEVLEILYE